MQGEKNSHELIPAGHMQISVMMGLQYGISRRLQDASRMAITETKKQDLAEIYEPVNS